MLKTEPERVERVDKPEREEKVQAPKPVGYPCKYCQGATEVTKTFPSYETTQPPIKIVKRRLRKCLVCGRSFTSQEETIKA